MDDPSHTLHAQSWPLFITNIFVLIWNSSTATEVSSSHTKKYEDALKSPPSSFAVSSHDQNGNAKTDRDPNAQQTGETIEKEQDVPQSDKRDNNGLSNINLIYLSRSVIIYFLFG